MAATASLLEPLNSASFFPLAAISLLALPSSSAASSPPSFWLAETVSLTSMPFASRNLDALTQEVHPPRW